MLPTTLENRISAIEREKQIAFGDWHKQALKNTVSERKFVDIVETGNSGCLEQLMRLSAANFDDLLRHELDAANILMLLDHAKETRMPPLSGLHKNYINSLLLSQQRCNNYNALIKAQKTQIESSTIDNSKLPQWVDDCSQTILSTCNPPMNNFNDESHLRELNLRLDRALTLQVRLITVTKHLAAINNEAQGSALPLSFGLVNTYSGAAGFCHATGVKAITKWSNEQSLGSSPSLDAVDHLVTAAEQKLLEVASERLATQPSRIPLFGRGDGVRKTYQAIVKDYPVTEASPAAIAAHQ